eukprot:1194587-Prorocentrum_minimum.AAC.2
MVNVSPTVMGGGDSSHAKEELRRSCPRSAFDLILTVDVALRYWVAVGFHEVLVSRCRAITCTPPRLRARDADARGANQPES